MLVEFEFFFDLNWVSLMQKGLFFLYMRVSQAMAQAMVALVKDLQSGPTCM
jgi:hypothetical protein